MRTWAEPSDRKPGWQVIVQDQTEKRLVHFDASLYSMKPSRRKRIMKNEARSGRSDHFGQGFLCNFRDQSLRFTRLPNSAIRRRILARRFSLELKSWSTRSAWARMLRARRNVRNRSEKACYSCIARSISARSILRAVQELMAVANWRLTAPAIDSSPTKLPAMRRVSVASLPAAQSVGQLARPN
jgi:hypothetical protein